MKSFLSISLAEEAFVESYVTNLRCPRTLVTGPNFDYYKFNASWSLLPHIASTQFITDFLIMQKVLEIVENPLNRFELESLRSNPQPDLSVPFTVSDCGMVLALAQH